MRRAGLLCEDALVMAMRFDFQRGIMALGGRMTSTCMRNDTGCPNDAAEVGRRCDVEQIVEGLPSDI